jgi:predicted O-methyltransferase YrrM
MSLLGFVRAHLSQLRGYAARRRILRGARRQNLEKALTNWSRSLADPTGFYRDCFRYFHLQSPAELQAHRHYFQSSQLGFGDDAFHVMWFLLFRKYKPRIFLEIGVYRGQVLSLAALLQRQLGFQGEVVGISPFEALGDSVSKYDTEIDYLADTRANFAHFNLPEPHLLKARSADSAALNLIASRKWDCIYIDGSHDYQIAKADWNICSSHINKGGLIVLDDAGLGTEFEPPIFSMKGHPGPSRVADEIDRTKFREVLQVGHNRVFEKLSD